MGEGIERGRVKIGEWMSFVIGSFVPCQFTVVHNNELKRHICKVSASKMFDQKFVAKFFQILILNYKCFY